MTRRPVAPRATGLSLQPHMKGTPVARTLIPMAGLIVPSLLSAAPAIASEATPGESPGDAIAQPDFVLPDGLLPEPDFGIASPYAGSSVADDATLAGATGMADVKVLEQAINVRNTSTISGNIINGDPTTGTISIDGGAFSNFNGMALVNANTGNNVSINAAMNVNVGIQ